MNRFPASQTARADQHNRILNTTTGCSALHRNICFVPPASLVSAVSSSSSPTSYAPKIMLNPLPLTTATALELTSRVSLGRPYHTSTQVAKPQNQNQNRAVQSSCATALPDLRLRCGNPDVPNSRFAHPVTSMVSRMDTAGLSSYHLSTGGPNMATPSGYTSSPVTFQLQQRPVEVVDSGILSPLPQLVEGVPLNMSSYSAYLKKHPINSVRFGNTFLSSYFPKQTSTDSEALSYGGSSGSSGGCSRSSLCSVDSTTAVKALANISLRQSQKVGLSKPKEEEAEDSPRQYLGARCNHSEFWKRLRSKKGFAYYVCQKCELRWRIPTAKFDYARGSRILSRLTAGEGFKFPSCVKSSLADANPSHPHQCDIQLRGINEIQKNSQEVMDCQLSSEAPSVSVTTSSSPISITATSSDNDGFDRALTEEELLFCPLHLSVPAEEIVLSQSQQEGLPATTIAGVISLLNSTAVITSFAEATSSVVAHTAAATALKADFLNLLDGPSAVDVDRRINLLPDSATADSSSNSTYSPFLTSINLFALLQEAVMEDEVEAHGSDKMK